MEKYSLKSVNWRLIKEIAQQMYADNKYLSPYSDYCFLDGIIKTSNIRLKKDFKKCRFDDLVLYKEGRPIYIAPLLVSEKEKTVFLAGHFNSVGHVDFIYTKDVTLEDFNALMFMLKERYRGYSYSFDRVSEFSKTFSFLMSNGCKPTEKEICVKIDFNDYDEWFSGLSKSCRQNIRTAYNRIKRENKDLRFVFFLNSQPEAKYYDDHISLFSRRILEHSKLTKLLYLPLKFFKKRDPLSRALVEYKDKIFSGIYLNNRLIGTLNGVIANDGRAIITRLSIDVKNGVYCPGGLLINETIKAIKKQTDINIVSLDLSRGDEKYKYTYGGCEHYNYTFVLKAETE